MFKCKSIVQKGSKISGYTVSVPKITPPPSGERKGGDTRLAERRNGDRKCTGKESEEELGMGKEKVHWKPARQLQSPRMVSKSLSLWHAFGSATRQCIRA